MRLLPRRSRHQWIIFLLLVCLIGVYLAYKSLSDSENKGKHHKHSHQALKDRTSMDPKMPINPDLLREAHSNDRVVDLKIIKPDVDDSGLMHNIRNLENDDDYVTDDERFARLKVLLNELSTTDWKAAKDADEMMIQVKSELSDLDIDSAMSCREIDTLKPGSSRGFGSIYGKKNVDPVRQGYDRDFIIKSVGSDQDLKIECMKQDYNHDRCSVMGNYKLMRELVFILTLKSPSIIKLEGFCLRGETVDPRISKKGAIILTEPSRPANIHSFYGLSWRQKLEMALKLMELLQYLETSPLGSLGFNKLALHDFVQVGEALKLVDLDSLHVGQIQCSSNKDCTIPEMTMKEIPCDRGHCTGRNALNNMLWLYRVLLTPLLENAPGASSRRDVNGLFSKIQILQITGEEVISELKKWIETAKGGMVFDQHQAADQEQLLQPAGQHVLDQRPADRYNNARVAAEKPQGGGGGLGPDQYIDRHGIVRRKHPDQYLDFNGELKWKPTQKIPEAQPKVDQGEAQEIFKPGEYEYERVPNANYPGLHDFRCQQSRVSWGCVVSVRTLHEAKSLCDQQEHCASFVIFSSNPDIDAVMTIVMKNSALGKPDPNYGATLFRKRKYSPQSDLPVDGGDSVAKQPETGVDSVAKQQAANGDLVAQQPAVGGDLVAKPPGSKQKTGTDLKGCLKKALNQTKSARASRERRLMIHLGLKGIDEEEWLTYAEFVSINKYLGPSDVTSKSTTRARFKFSFEDNALGLKKGEFLDERGPLFHHIGYLVTYHLDRVLGLYHTPPTVARRLARAGLEKVKGDSKWRDEILPKLLENVGQPSVVSVPMPPVMQTETLALQELDTTPTNVVPFTRNQKVHLEYMLLWALTRQSHPQKGFMGYKGHLIHFEADLAFNNLKKSQIGYFYHCQFPNSVYKTLVCYKCADSNKLTKICGLGEDVITRMGKSGFGPDTIKVGSMGSGEITQVINNSAGAILTVVEHCIKNYGREKVLY